MTWTQIHMIPCNRCRLGWLLCKTTTCVLAQRSWIVWQFSEVAAHVPKCPLTPATSASEVKRLCNSLCIIPSCDGAIEYMILSMMIMIHSSSHQLVTQMNTAKPQHFGMLAALFIRLCRLRINEQGIQWVCCLIACLLRLNLPVSQTHAHQIKWHHSNIQIPC